MYIVQIASELAPIAKVGGLADVMMGLSRELKKQGHRVDIIIPKYQTLATQKLSFEKEPSSFNSYFKGNWHHNLMHKAHFNSDFSIQLLEPEAFDFFSRSQIYGFQDDADRFMYFSRAVVDYLHQLSEIPDVIHLHDWHTAAVSFLLRDQEFREKFAKTVIVLTIHNLAYQGRCASFNLDDAGYRGPKEPLYHPNRQEGSTDCNLLKAGIISADKVTTVSPTYAKEILSPDKSEGLYETLDANKQKFQGVLNGLDYTYWNPLTDYFLDTNYSYRDLKLKVKNKWALADELGLTRSIDKPLLASVLRLVPQKGVHLLHHAVQNAEDAGYQMVLLGTASDPQIIQEFEALQKTYENHPHIRIILKNEEELAHKLYAASDLFLVPSIFEPCGLTQMIALRYGSVPIVRNTGGLADTVVDVETSGRPLEETSGFVFNEPSPHEMMEAVMRAVSMYKNKKDEWHKLMAFCMQRDFSWEKATKSYLKIYSNCA